MAPSGASPASANPVTTGMDGRQRDLPRQDEVDRALHLYEQYVCVDATDRACGDLRSDLSGVDNACGVLAAERAQ